jgi:hypothetical protein
MNESVKAKWLEALRSGKYKQFRSKLKDGNKFCCLGVLCDIHSQETGKKWKTQKDGTAVYIDSGNVLPVEVAEWAGVSSQNPSVKFGWMSRSLAELNDFTRLSFRDIADLIEKSLVTAPTTQPASPPANKAEPDSSSR